MSTPVSLTRLRYFWDASKGFAAAPGNSEPSLPMEVTPGFSVFPFHPGVFLGLNSQ